MIHTAGCIIIGDEVLGGKTVDTNSTYMAKYCFNLGMSLKKIEVIGDDEEEIVEATRRMSNRYDFVVTSGGIGPTSVCHFELPSEDGQVVIDARTDMTTSLTNQSPRRST